MSNAFPDLILLDAVAAPGAGLAVGIGGEGMRYQNSLTKINSNRYPHQFKIRYQLADSTTGATATIQFQESDDNSSYTTVYTKVLTITATTNTTASHQLFKSSKRYVRLNVSALSGGSAPVVRAYMRLGTFGT